MMASNDQDVPAANSGGSPPVELPDVGGVVNVGLSLFGDSLRAQDVEVVDVEWSIPASGDEELVAGLAQLYGARALEIEEANREVVRRLDEATPALVRVRRAGDVVPGLGERMVLHPGPPLEFSRFCDPLRRSVYATVVSSGWARDSEEAQKLIEAGEIELDSAHHHSAALSMATTFGPEDPVFEVHDPQGGKTAYCAMNQGPGQRAWLGVDNEEAVAHQKWLRDVAGPLLDEALRDEEPIDLFSIASQAVQMGDDVHMRLQASTNLLIRTLLPRIAALEDPRRAELAAFLSENYLFFLNLIVPASKATIDWASEVRGTTLVTCISRNGTTFGVQVPGRDREWVISDAPPVQSALFRGDFGPDDAAPDIGDSAIVELVGLGGAAAAGSPAVAGFLGGRMEDAIAQTQELAQVCVSNSSRFKLPILDFEGTPLGVDLRKVVELEITPSITTGILDRKAGRGQVGAGVATAPLDVFQATLRQLVQREAADSAVAS